MLWVAEGRQHMPWWVYLILAAIMLGILAWAHHDNDDHKGSGW